MSSGRATQGSDDLSLLDDDVMDVKSKFTEGAADWALFGYTAPDDPRSKLRLLRTGLSARDGPVQTNLDPVAITFGVFKAQVPGTPGPAPDVLSATSTIESKDTSDGLLSAGSEGPIVSFGFFGSSSSIAARTKWVSHRKLYEAQFTRLFGTRAHLELRKPSELEPHKVSKALSERRDSIARKSSPFRVDTRCDVTDPELRRVFESIHNDAELTNWMICGYATENKLEVVASGNDAIKALSTHPADRARGSMYEHLSTCGSRPMYIYMRLNGLPRVSTLSSNSIAFADVLSPQAVAESGLGQQTESAYNSSWSLKGSDCSSTYVLVTWHAHGQDALSKSTSSDAGSTAGGSLTETPSSRSVGADVMRARAAIVAHASTIQKFFVHDFGYHAFSVEDITTDRILSEVRRITHIDHFRISVEVFDGPGCPVAQRMKHSLRRVVVDIGCGETLGALTKAVEAKVRGTVRLYRLSQAAPHSSETGHAEMSRADQAKWFGMLGLKLPPTFGKPVVKESTGKSTSVGTLLQILSEQSTEVSRWLSHGDTLYAERLGSNDPDVLAAAAAAISAAAAATATAAQLASTTPIANGGAGGGDVKPNHPSHAEPAEIAKTVANVRSIRLQQMLQERSLRRNASSSLRKLVESSNFGFRSPSAADATSASPLDTIDETKVAVSAAASAGRSEGVSPPVVGDGIVRVATPPPVLPSASITSSSASSAVIATGSSISVRELVARHQSSKSQSALPSTPELTRRRRDVTIGTPADGIASPPMSPAGVMATESPPSTRQQVQPSAAHHRHTQSAAAVPTSSPLPPRSRRMSVRVDDTGQPSIDVIGDKDDDGSCGGLPELNFQEIERLNALGQGRTAVVFRGIWRPASSAQGNSDSGDVSYEVAVKVFTYMKPLPPPSVIAAFSAELGIMSGLNHPNLVSIVGATTHPRLSIVMPYCSQGTLYGVLRDSSFQLSFLDKCYLAHDVASGLAYLHSRGIMHRDIKSHNVLLDLGPSRLTAKIADFGSTKTLVDTSDLAFTEIGTSGWTAPEVFGANPDETGYGVQADIWSFAVLLWELIVPNPVANRFVGVPTVRYCRELAGGARLDIPPETDEDYAKLIRSCWEWCPASRPKAPQLVDALQVIIERLNTGSGACRTGSTSSE